MEESTRPVSPLRQRMLDDIRMRKFAEHTQEGYIRAVRKLAGFLGRSPDTAMPLAGVRHRFSLSSISFQHARRSAPGRTTVNSGRRSASPVAESPS